MAAAWLNQRRGIAAGYDHALAFHEQAPGGHSRVGPLPPTSRPGAVTHVEDHLSGQLRGLVGQLQPAVSSWLVPAPWRQLWNASPSRPTPASSTLHTCLSLCRSHRLKTAHLTHRELHEDQGRTAGSVPCRRPSNTLPRPGYGGLRLHTGPGQPNPSLAWGFAGGKVGGG